MLSVVLALLVIYVLVLTMIGAHYGTSYYDAKNTKYLRRSNNYLLKPLLLFTSDFDGGVILGFMVCFKRENCSLNRSKIFFPLRER